MGEVLDQVESVAQNVAMEVESEEAAVPFDETAPDSTPQVCNSNHTLSLLPLTDFRLLQQ